MILELFSFFILSQNTKITFKPETCKAKVIVNKLSIIQDSIDNQPVDSTFDANTAWEGYGKAPDPTQPPVETNYVMPDWTGYNRFEPQYIDLFKKYFGSDWQIASFIANYESGYDQNVISSNGMYYGIMQIEAGFWSPVFGIQPNDLLNAETNIGIAKAILDQSSWQQQWPNTYQMYLNQ